MQKKKFKVTPLERAWILYDVGNSAFVLMIATLVPIFFNALAEAGGVSKVNYLAYWGYASSVVTVITAVLGPILGTLADTKNFKKPIFMLCLFVGVLGCCAMGAARTWLPFLVVFIVAKIGFSGSLVFYDSMLGDVTTPERMDMVSSRGYAWGYIGSCIPFGVCLVLVLAYESIGISMEAAMELLGKVKEYADIAEVGTPFLMEYGMEAVRRIHAGFPGLSVLCDGKIMDAGGYEAELAFRAGADYVTVLAVTDDRTILDVAAAANKYGKKTVADMICVENLKERSRQLEELGVDVIAVHTGVDQQAAGRTPLQDLKELRSAVTCAQIAVAGGIRLNTLDAYLEYEPEIIIVGGGIVHAEDPAGETKKLAEKIRERKR